MNIWFSFLLPSFFPSFVFVSMKLCQFEILLAQKHTQYKILCKISAFKINNVCSFLKNTVLDFEMMTSLLFY